MNPGSLRSPRHWALAALIGLAVSMPSARSQDDGFHTNPACWDGPRIYHRGRPAADLADRVHITKTQALQIPGEATSSPNGAYRFWVRNPDTTQSGIWNAALVVDVEREEHLTVLIERVAQPINPVWINEKLIFVRIAWGRIAFTDLILDVEAGALIYQEAALWGEIAHDQFKQACGGACPCDPAQESSAPTLPQSRPGPDALIGLVTLPTVFGPGESGGPVAAENPMAVPVYAAPRKDAALLDNLSRTADFETREYTYEGAAAVVYERQGDWFRIGLRKAMRDGAGTGWIPAANTGQYMPIEEVLIGKLAYLTEHWDGRIWSAPAIGSEVHSSALHQGDGIERQEIPAEILGAQKLGSGLWLKVKTLDPEPCSGKTPETIDSGWVPAYSVSGELTAWFYSRGC